MAKMALNLKTLRDLDTGMAAATFDRELERIIDDCQERPGLEKDRVVAMQVVVRPRQQNGVPTGTCDVTILVQARVPKSQTATYVGELRKVANGHMLVIDIDSPDDPKQATFGDLPESGGPPLAGK